MKATTKVVWLLVVASAAMMGPTRAQEPLKIGAPTSLSGRYTTYGVQARRGIEGAVEAWKKHRGDKVAGRPIEVVVRDTQSNTALMVSTMNALIETEKVDIIIGGDGSNVAAAGVPPWKKAPARPIWIMPGASTDIIEREIGADPYFFHTYPWSYHYHSSLVSALALVVGQKKRVAILYSDGAYGRSHIEDARSSLKEAGFNIVAEELMREGAADYSPTLVKMRALRPDIIYTIVQTNDAVQLAKQMQSARLQAPYLVGTGQVQLPEWQDSVGDAQNCWIGVTSWMPGLGYPADKKESQLFPLATEWENDWTKKYSRQPEFFDAGYYASTIIALLAVEATGSTDRDKLKDWLVKQDYQTMLGSSKFSKSRISLHQAFDKIVVFQRQKTAAGFQNTLLFPREIASGSPQTCN
jgi:branched-chain amino acid transport system substrate-binding protein